MLTAHLNHNPPVEEDTQPLREIFIRPTGHKRCSICHEIILNMTDDCLLVCADEFISEIDSDRLPENFDPHTLPEGLCPDCKEQE